MRLATRQTDEIAREAARKHWDLVAKPLYSLGCFEDMVVKIAGIQRTENIRVDKKCVLVFCGDHGVVREGVSQSDSDVTFLVAESIASGNSNINSMAEIANATVYAVDMGMRKESHHPAMLMRRQGSGTANMTQSPSMTREQTESAMQAGIDLVGEMKREGFDIVAVGEMGIGNTTAASALASVFLRIPLRDAIGRGAGLSDEGMLRKQKAIEKAIAVNRPDECDPMDVVSKLGGFDIAGMTGAFLGGMVYEMPMVVDGFVSAVAALAAQRISRQTTEYMLASHVSKEKLGQRLLEELGLEPPLHARMGLGEGTGAVMLFPLLDMALRVYGSIHTFQKLGMEAYLPQGGAQ